MADYFTKASFLIRVTALESSVIREAFDLRIDELLGEQAASAYQRRSRAFKDLFPEGREDSFDRFLSLFTDPENPTAGCNIDEFERSGDSVSLVMYGDQIDPESLANLLQVLAPSALPFGFAFTHDCSKLRPGSLGGGFVTITDTSVTFRETETQLTAAISHLESDDSRPLVIAKFDAEHGLSFWNEERGFGRLADATVYSADKARTIDLPIADEQPEWLTLPLYSD